MKDEKAADEIIEMTPEDVPSIASALRFNPHITTLLIDMLDGSC